jgi:hypothetical protein
MNKAKKMGNVKEQEKKKKRPVNIKKVCIVGKQRRLSEESKIKL